MLERLSKKTALMNIATGIILQLCNIVSTFIIPKLVLSAFGSEVNGLVSSITNFLLYISLFEASVSNIVMTSLYKPIQKRDTKSISRVFNTSDLFYKRITFLFLIYTIILSVTYPLLFPNSFSFTYTMALVIVLSLSYLIQYSFSNSLRTLLKANKQVYIVNITQTIILLSTIILTILSIKIFPNIHLLKLLSGVLYLLQPLIFSYSVKKNYSIDKKAGVDKKLLKSRWDGFAISVAAFIHNMTDVALLTMFCSLETVSVYSVYYLVIRGLEAIMTSISNSIVPILGNMHVSCSKAKMRSNYLTYESIYISLILFVFSVASTLITPFVQLYTLGINDANYYEPIFGYLAIISETMFLLKIPSQNLAFVTNKYKKMKWPSYIEASINVIVSLILVGKMGIVGVGIGTLVAMAYNMIYQIRLAKTTLDIKANQYLKYAISVIILLFTSLICTSIFKIDATSWSSWLQVAIINTSILGAVTAFIFAVFYKKDFYSLIKYLKK